MKINQLNGFAYDKESKVIGGIAGVDFIKQTLTIMTDDDDMVVAKLSDIEILEQIGYIGKTGIINHDVLQTLDGKRYEIVLQEQDDIIQMHLLNDKLERIEAGAFIKVSELNQLKPYAELVGNIYELQNDVKTVDFNVVIVRSFKGGECKYYYACNNEANEEVDLIKVIFIGSQLLEEEKHERITIPHGVYLDAVEVGEYKEVNPQELMNYVTGLTYGKKKEEPTYEEEVEAERCEECDEEYCYCDVNVEDIEEEEEDLDYCEECGEHVDDCECRGW